MAKISFIKQIKYSRYTPPHRVNRSRDHDVSWFPSRLHYSFPLLTIHTAQIPNQRSIAILKESTVTKSCDCVDSSTQIIFSPIPLTQPCTTALNLKPSVERGVFTSGRDGFPETQLPPLSLIVTMVCTAIPIPFSSAIVSFAQTETCVSRQLSHRTIFRLTPVFLLRSYSFPSRNLSTNHHRHFFVLTLMLLIPDIIYRNVLSSTPAST